MEVRPEFKEVRHNVGLASVSASYMFRIIKELHEKYKDDRLIELLQLAHTANSGALKVLHWMYKEHREEMLAYDEEICSVVSDIQHD